MLITGLDYHPSFQQIAFVDNETGEYGERQLLHKNGEAEQFYRELKQQGVKVRIAMEATGHARWFERLIGELDFELWIGDPATHFVNYIGADLRRTPTGSIAGSAIRAPRG